jgi:hypothetical protein
VKSQGLIRLWKRKDRQIKKKSKRQHYNSSSDSDDDEWFESGASWRENLYVCMCTPKMFENNSKLQQ